jgi:hypothetical protein
VALATKYLKKGLHNFKEKNLNRISSRNRFYNLVMCIAWQWHSECFKNGIPISAAFFHCIMYIICNTGNFLELAAVYKNPVINFLIEINCELSFMADTFPPPPSASPEGGGVQLRRRKGPPPPPAALPAEPPSPASGSSLCSSRYSLISLSRPPSFLFKFQQSILVGIEKNIVISFIN